MGAAGLGNVLYERKIDDKDEEDRMDDDLYDDNRNDGWSSPFSLAKVGGLTLCIRGRGVPRISRDP